VKAEEKAKALGKSSTGGKAAVEKSEGSKSVQSGTAVDKAFRDAFTKAFSFKETAGTAEAAEKAANGSGVDSSAAQENKQKGADDDSSNKKRKKGGRSEPAEVVAPTLEPFNLGNAMARTFEDIGSLITPRNSAGTPIAPPSPSAGSSTSSKK
jgi:hypothetical protein